MQVVKPIDIENALRIDLAAIVGGFRFFAPPLPPDLKAGDVCVRALSGSTISAASNVYDVTIECYESNEADAIEAANEIAGVVASLPLRETQTQYSDARPRIPYLDPDPRAPQLARYTFGASLICPGERLTF